jgi:hypothetical protein
VFANIIGIMILFFLKLITAICQKINQLSSPKINFCLKSVMKKPADFSLQYAYGAKQGNGYFRIALAQFLGAHCHY